MKTLFRSFRYRHGFVASCFLCTLLATLFLPITASAGDQENSIGKSADSEGLPPSSLPERRLTRSTPRWTVSAEAIVLGRIGGVNRTLVARVPGDVPFYTTLRYVDCPWRRSFQQQPVSTRFFRRTENKPDLPRRFRLRRGVVVFQHLRPERHQSHWPRQSGRLAGDEGSRHLLANSRFPVPRQWHGVPPRIFITSRPTGGWISPAG